MSGVITGGAAHDAIVAFIILAAGLATSGFMSASIAALTAASHGRLAALEKAGDVRAATANRLLKAKERLIGAGLIATSLLNIALVAFAASLSAAHLGAFGALYATLGMTALVVVTVIAARTLAIAEADRIAPRAARAIAWIVAAFGPVHDAIALLIRRALRLFGVRIEDSQPVLSAHEELTGSVDLMGRESGQVKSDRDMIGGLLDLKDLIVADVMIHRTKMRAIDADQPAEAIVREVLASPYTRMPLWRDSPENVIGLIHAKDLLRALDAAGGDPARVDMKAIAIPPWFAPDTTALPDMLRAFLQKKTHFAFVIDEYGVVMGLVTLEDVIEEIVGDIKDEHDVASSVRPQSDGGVIVEGATPIRDLNRAMDWDLPDEAATTIAGLVITEARIIPDAGQIFTFHGYRFAVLRRQRNRITALRITPIQKTEFGNQKSDEGR